MDDLDLDPAPEWLAYDATSERIYLESLADAPLIPNYRSCEAIDTEPQRLVPVYLDFENGRWFFYEKEAADLGVTR